MDQHLVVATELRFWTHSTKAVSWCDLLLKTDSIAQSAHSAELHLNLVTVSQK